MTRWIITIYRRHGEAWLNPSFLTSASVAAALFAVSIIASFYAGIYATERASSPVGDLILSNIPVYDVEQFFIWGSLLLILFIVGLLVIHPNRIPFVLYSLALFYFIRSVFVSLTHLGPFPTRIALDSSEIAAKMFGGADLFFSGHTGTPFLLALMFWHEPRLRYFFLASSVFFAVIVLLGHLHYSIDVLAAFFITYGIYHMALYFFPKERSLFLS